MLRNVDKEINDLCEKERMRQESGIELIASENFVSKAVLEAMGTVLTNKYADGYPGNRCYTGCEIVDEVENLAIERCKQLFNAKYANVQPYSGSQANMAVYRALLNKGDIILALALTQGGHITHGGDESFAGQDYKYYPYYLNKETEALDYDEIEKIALDIKPKLIIAGSSCYPLQIDYKRFREIADKSGAMLMVDIAHVAGIIAAGRLQNPVDYAHVVTSTTHKTMRGPRGGMILTNDGKIAKKIDEAVFPGTQGCPIMNIIAGKAVCFKEALDPSFKEYIDLVLSNSKQLVKEMQSRGYRIVCNNTDNHLLIVDVYNSIGVTGKVAEDILYKIGITVNKIEIPYDKLSSDECSGIRIGTAAISSRGFKSHEIEEIARLIDQGLRNKDNEEKLACLKQEVVSLTRKFPLHK